MPPTEADIREAVARCGAICAQTLGSPVRRGLPVFLTFSLSLSEHANEYRPEGPVLLAVDQQLDEGAALRVAPELSDPVACPLRERSQYGYS